MLSLAFSLTQSPCEFVALLVRKGSLSLPGWVRGLLCAFAALSRVYAFVERMTMVPSSLSQPATFRYHQRALSHSASSIALKVLVTQACSTLRPRGL